MAVFWTLGASAFIELAMSASCVQGKMGYNCQEKIIMDVLQFKSTKIIALSLCHANMLRISITG